VLEQASCRRQQAFRLCVSFKAGFSFTFKVSAESIFQQQMLFSVYFGWQSVFYVELKTCCVMQLNDLGGKHISTRFRVALVWHKQADFCTRDLFSLIKIHFQQTADVHHSVWKVFLFPRQIALLPPIFQCYYRAFHNISYTSSKFSTAGLYNYFWVFFDAPCLRICKAVNSA
jgi:hypothetical protein